MIKINQYNGEMIYVGGESNFVLITGKEIPNCCVTTAATKGGGRSSIPEKRSIAQYMQFLFFFNPHMSFFVVDLSALYNVFLV